MHATTETAPPSSATASTSRPSVRSRASPGEEVHSSSNWSTTSSSRRSGATAAAISGSGSETNRRLSSAAGGPPDVAAALEGTAAGNNPCVEVAEQPRASGTQVIERRSSGFRLLGLPTVAARVDTDGRFGQLTARLWDVFPDGRQRIVTQGVYRLREDQRGRIVFQMLGSGYRFAEGNTVKVELLGRDPPTFRQSNPDFKVRVSEVTV